MVKEKKIKQKRVINEDMTNIRNLFILLIIVVLVVIGLYYLTESLVNKENSNTNKIDAVIDYDIATIGTMFNRIEDEYYVLIYSNEKYGSELDNILITYRSSDEYIKTYYVDLDKKINSIAVSEETTSYPKHPSDVKVSDAVLYKISNGNVVSSSIGVDKIKSVLNKDE